MILVWSLAGGAAGSLVLATVLRLGSELQWTRMDLPLLLGEMWTGNRERAKEIGWVLQFAAGLVFSLVYAGIFAATGRSGWGLGAALGLLHGLVAGTVIVETFLPFVHGRIGSRSTAADAAPLLEPPGFLLVNYGLATPVISLLGHMVYGALVGGFTSLAS